MNVDKPARMNNRLRPLPPSEELLFEARRLFKYEPETGELIRIAHKHTSYPGMGKIGMPVGGDDGHGYRMCALLGHKFKVHQIVWLMCNEKLPELPIDHIDHDRRNNKVGNLRLVTDFENMQNLSAAKSSMTGIRKDDKGNGWSANINIGKKKTYLGYFKTKEDARAAYVAASRIVRGEF